MDYSPSEARYNSRLNCQIQLHTDVDPPAPQHLQPHISLTNSAYEKAEWIDRQLSIHCFGNLLVTPEFTDLFIFIRQRKGHFDI